MESLEVLIIVIMNIMLSLIKINKLKIIKSWICFLYSILRFSNIDDNNIVRAYKLNIVN